MRKLDGATFNLLYGRPTEHVVEEVELLLRSCLLDWCAVQEAEGYAAALRKIPGFSYHTTRAYPGGAENGILVRDGINVTRPLFSSIGDGWTTIRGGHHAATSFARVTLDGWLRLGTLHAPTPIDVTGRVMGPRERIDDYRALMRRVTRFMNYPHPRARLIVGDWNQHPSNTHRMAPAGIAQDTGSTVWAPDNGIDWGIGKHCRVTDVTKILRFPTGSDHRPVLFTVRP